VNPTRTCCADTPLGAAEEVEINVGFTRNVEDLREVISVQQTALRRWKSSICRIQLVLRIFERISPSAMLIGTL
jgi:hypothetical protein